MASWATTLKYGAGALCSDGQSSNCLGPVGEAGCFLMGSSRPLGWAGLGTSIICEAGQAFPWWISLGH